MIIAHQAHCSTTRLLESPVYSLLCAALRKACPFYMYRSAQTCAGHVAYTWEMLAKWKDDENSGNLNNFLSALILRCVSNKIYCFTLYCFNLSLFKMIINRQ